MRKRVICLILALLVGLTVFSVSFSAAGGELGSCKKLFAYSDNDAAYFYGYYGGTLVSERVIPDEMTRTVTTDGVIRMVCHNEYTTYALLKTRVGQFSAGAGYEQRRLHHHRAGRQPEFLADRICGGRFANLHHLPYLKRNDRQPI